MKSRLLLVAGHGGSDAGAVRGALLERDLNIAVVLGANDVIGRTYRTAPTTIGVLTYPPDAPVDGESGLLAKIAAANAIGSDLLLVEVHHNADAAGTGAQIWISQHAGATAGDESAVIAPILSAQLGQLVGEPVPILTSDHSRFGKLGILDDVTATAVLVEARNVDALDTPAGLYAQGAAIAAALGLYFGWPAIVSAAVVPSIDKLGRAKELAGQIVAL